jgi:MFS family permease
MSALGYDDGVVMTAGEYAQALPQTPIRTARWAVATIFLVNGTLIANWFARIPNVKDSLGLSTSVLGIALLCAAVGALIAQPTSGWMIGRVGSRVVTTTMAFAFCVSVIPLGFAPTLPLLMLALFFMGACNGALDVAMNAQAAQVEKAYGRSIMNSFHGLWSVGGLTGAILGGLAVSRQISTGPHLLVVAVIGFGVMVVASRGLVPDRGTHADGEGSGFALPPRVLVPMGIVAFFVLFCEGAIGDWSTIYLRDDVGVAEGRATLGFAIFSLLMATGRLTGDWLTTRLGAALLLRISGVLIIAGMVLALVTSSVWLSVVGFGFVGAGISCTFPLLLSAASRTPGIAPGTAIAAIATAGYTGFLVGPPLLGTLAEVPFLGLRGALALLTISGVLVVLLGRSVERPHAAGSSAD